MLYKDKIQRERYPTRVDKEQNKEENRIGETELRKNETKYRKRG